MVKAVGRNFHDGVGRCDMRFALGSLAALFVVAAFLGCDRERCEDRGQEAIQAVLPHLNQDVVSNLVREASVCITNSSVQPVAEPFYTPTSEEAPVAYGLKVESTTEFRVSTGPLVVVRNRGTSAPYMAVRVPVHFGSGLCLWGVYVCVKPGGGFAKDNPSWVSSERGTNAAPVVKLSDEVLLYAQQRSLQ
jgi:hypothetical protein